MIEVKKESERKIQRALLVGIQDFNMTAAEAGEHLSELSELAETFGIKKTDQIQINVVLKNLCPKYLVGTGKAEEIAKIAAENNAEGIIFDAELSPSQQRNWELLSKLPVIDRQELIIDIFAERAKTKEAALQVELARLEYSLPRLKRAWTHLSRQRGGISGMRGEGEQQIEVDRRIVKARIAKLKKDLADIEAKRKLERKLSERNKVPRIAIVGYTNAGKSSLLKTLCGADVYIEDKLFATLDTTTRKLKLPDGQTVIVSDTVGFIRKLPHSLIEAFKSTLEEAVYSDILIHVLDISSPFWEEHLKTTLSVLSELGAAEKPIITALNKSDIQTDPLTRAVVKNALPQSIMISALTGEGLDNLKKAIADKLSFFNKNISLRIPPERHDIAALLHKLGTVLEQKYDKMGFIMIRAKIETRFLAKFSEYQIPDENF